MKRCCGEHSVLLVRDARWKQQCSLVSSLGQFNVLLASAVAHLQLLPACLAGHSAQLLNNIAHPQQD